MDACRVVLSSFAAARWHGSSARNDPVRLNERLHLASTDALVTCTVCGRQTPLLDQSTNHLWAEARKGSCFLDIEPLRTPESDRSQPAPPRQRLQSL
jgi:hypothetical protein